MISSLRRIPNKRLLLQQVRGAGRANAGGAEPSSSLSPPLFAQRCWYASTPPVKDEDGEAVALKMKKRQEAKEAKRLRQDYNIRRAAYNRQVSQLRKQYAEEVAQQRAADQAEREALKRDDTRRRLERQRLKNIRSATNALKEKAKRERTARAFARHLQRQQVIREGQQARFAAARQLVVDEIEKEAPLWLTTAEEIEAAFSPEAEQLLWARPGGVVGAPNPSLDAHFWQNETHTWHVNKTYKSQRQILFENVLELVYEDANLDKSFWTPERLGQAEAVERQARLRAEVQRAGKKELLRRQAQMLTEQYQSQNQGSDGGGSAPAKLPPPSLKMLANTKALEREGARILFADPTRFFVFDNATTDDDQVDQGGDMVPGAEEGRDLSRGPDGQVTAYGGPTLGAPIDIRKTNTDRFPRAIGKDPKADTRTEKEKKQEAREQKLLEAARAEEVSALDLAADEQDLEDLEPDIDYDDFQWQSDDEEWKKGLRPDSPLDQEISSVPPQYRYKEEDIDWVLSKLGEEASFHAGELGSEIESLQQQLRSQAEQESPDGVVPAGSLDDILLSMSNKELLALSDLDDAYVAADGDLSTTEFAKHAEQIPSLTEDQLRLVLDRSRE